MIEQAGTLVLGFGLGLSLAVPPGPILAFAADRTVREGFWPGVSVPLGATTGDATQALLMGLGVLPLLAAHDRLLGGINVLGGVLMLVFAWLAWRGANRELDGDEQEVGHARGFGAGYLMAITSPFNFAWWFGVGVGLFDSHGWLLFVGFFAALVAWSFAFVAITKWAHGKLPIIVSWISVASAVALAGFGAWILYRSIPGML